MGEAIANTLVQTDNESRIYELIGSEIYSYQDVAEILSEIAGEDVYYTDADAVAFPDILKNLGIPERMIMVASGFTTDIRNHQYEIISPNLEQLLGRKPKNLNEALKEIYGNKI
ncbi:hypothetical protein SAMN05444388_11914 [Flavobacterium johnsoniae]|uniref:Uncharacterized protein n=2 Tax=Flavobacterium johnsoniae TaxID=986 RepID=A0A1M5VPZ7_FLAJO|nr:hypothetical protein SAMN05444388_11914 [Flavobacterium johnsoniae]